MVFGFNTDVKHEGTVYHVLSEPKPKESLLQSMVFVRGHCLGKYVTSFAQATGENLPELDVHELLKRQHGRVIDAIRKGELNQLLGGSTAGGHAAG